jgi:hypothetical protein
LLSAVRTAAGFLTNTLPANDDGSTGLVSISFPINFGDLQQPRQQQRQRDLHRPECYTPFDLRTSADPRIAPSSPTWTPAAGSALVTYQDGRGRRACAPSASTGWTWATTAHHTDKTNSFQLVLIDRSDVVAGALDIEFNYDRLTWKPGTPAAAATASAASPPAPGTPPATPIAA